MLHKCLVPKQSSWNRGRSDVLWSVLSQKDHCAELHATLQETQTNCVLNSCEQVQSLYSGQVLLHGSRQKGGRQSHSDLACSFQGYEAEPCIRNVNVLTTVFGSLWSFRSQKDSNVYDPPDMGKELLLCKLKQSPNSSGPTKNEIPSVFFRMNEANIQIQVRPVQTQLPNIPSQHRSVHNS